LRRCHCPKKNGPLHCHLQTKIQNNLHLGSSGLLISPSAGEIQSFKGNAANLALEIFGYLNIPLT
jgi:hypothetical protein